MLLSVSNLPPLGFQVRIPETGFETTKYTGLEDTVNEVLKHRIANPRFGWATDKASIRAWVLNSVEARLRAMPGGAGMGWLVPDSPPPDPSFSLPRRQRQPARAEVDLSAAAGVVEPKRVMPGIGTLLSWLGSGLKPVDQATANSRAKICANCVNNVELDGLKKAIGTAGDILHSIAEIRNHMKLATPHDGQLRQCSACWCVLSFKVWAPAGHIREGTTPEMKNLLSSECWIRPLLDSD